MYRTGKDHDDRFAELSRAIRKSVLANDPAVEETIGPYLNSDAAFCYAQEGVLKYALTSTVRGLSFHSMVMTSNEEIFRFARHRLTGVRMQKACFAIPAPEAFDMGAFADFICINASQDFQPVIEHYAKLTKRKKSATR